MESPSQTRSHFRIGSRRSQLALLQTKDVIAQLEAKFPDCTFEIAEINTKGDKILDVALSKIGDKGLFTKELEDALYSGEVDFAVHSLKDIPTKLPKDLVIGAICKRHDPRDCLVVNEKHKHLTLQDLPKGSVIGSSSLRRVAQLRRAFPHLLFEDIRGNLNTRLFKLDHPEQQKEKGLPCYDALVLAVAGLERLGFKDRIHQILSTDVCLHAVGQGALAVECRQNDHQLLEMLQKIHDKDTAICCEAERGFLRELEGGCQVPVGVSSSLEKDKVILEGIVLNLDGTQIRKGTNQDSIDHSTECGRDLAIRLKKEGAQLILQQVLESSQK